MRLAHGCHTAVRVSPARRMGNGWGLSICVVVDAEATSAQHSWRLAVQLERVLGPEVLLDEKVSDGFAERLGHPHGNRIADLTLD